MHFDQKYHWSKMTVNIHQNYFIENFHTNCLKIEEQADCSVFLKSLTYLTFVIWRMQKWSFLISHPKWAHILVFEQYVTTLCGKMLIIQIVQKQKRVHFRGGKWVPFLSSNLTYLAYVNSRMQKERSSSPY